MADKRMTEDGVVAELRSEVTDLSVVTFGPGPDVPPGGGAVDR
ncbi:hypothetical protein RM555_16330 [Micromonospora sp. DSM 115977]|uniref:Uncharacterized protein n=1 Tax=Micromonospora reichwaldensis TaxID=3075516 RepID=A0ABU2WYY4_9ACTN|nr:hypothetical protein [Micromonospora sp. DSM 115977]MDT0530561.1 hypothetical protein [Micromonospora sp. DSM 115977]